MNTSSSLGEELEQLRYSKRYNNSSYAAWAAADSDSDSVMIKGGGGPEPSRRKVTAEKAAGAAAPAMSGAVHGAIQSLGQLGNTLPTGTALVFQFLLPIVTEAGKCPAVADTAMVATLIVICSLSCFILAFTDTYTVGSTSANSTTNNTININTASYYGFATRRGLWIPARSGAPADVIAAGAVDGSYRLSALDFIHAFLSLIVFATSALFDPDVQACFYPHQLPPHLQQALPTLIAFFASLILFIFPSTRRSFDQPPPILASPTLPPAPVKHVSGYL